MTRLLMSFSALAGLVGPPAPPVPPPAGGYPLRMVKTLARVAEPPGGLVPYRRGRLWGYADTTGRVVIAPVFAGETSFFAEGWAEVPAQLLPSQLAVPADSVAPAPSNPVAYLNAQGEVLVVADVALVQTDGRLRAGWAFQHPGALALPRFHPSEGDPRRFLRLPDHVPYRIRPHQYGPNDARAGHSLGEGHYYYAAAVGAAPPPASPPQVPWDGNQPVGYAFAEGLADSTGRPLGPAQFEEIKDFRAGLATVLIDTNPTRWRGPRYPVGPSRGYGLIDRQGHVRTSRLYNYLEYMGNGYTKAWLTGEAGSAGAPTATVTLLDSLGRQVFPATPALQLGYFDEAGYLVVRRVQRPGDTLTYFVDAHNQPVFPQAGFRAATGFFNGSCRATDPAGRVGLLDKRGRWLTPLAYDQIQLPEEWSAFESAFQPSRPGHSTRWQDWQGSRTPRDNRYVLVRRQQRVGFVDRATGRETVPARYDYVVMPPTRGLASAMRNRQNYVLNLQGQELLAAAYYGDWYDSPQGTLYQVFNTANDDNTWSIIDSTGHRLLPWLPGTGYRPPTGHAVLVGPPPRTALLDSAGHVLLPYGSEPAYAGGAVAAGFHYNYAAHPYPEWQYWPTESNEAARPTRPAYLLPAPAGADWYLLDATARFSFARPQVAFTSPAGPAMPRYAGRPRLLPGGWYVARRQPDGRAVLLSPTGHPWVAPAGYRWAQANPGPRSYFGSRASDEPAFGQGVSRVVGEGAGQNTEPAEGGYVTRSGRQLWAD